MKKIILTLVMVLMYGNAWANVLDCKSLSKNAYKTAANILIDKGNYEKASYFLEYEVKPNLPPREYEMLNYALALVSAAPFKDVTLVDEMVIYFQIEHLEKICKLNDGTVYN